MEKQKLYTIGYTLFRNNDGIDTNKMFELLKRLGVSYLVDVRSVPYSKQYPQCNIESLKSVGERYNIPCIHIPQLGAKANIEQNVFSKASDIFFTDIFPISKSNRPEKNELFDCEEIVDFRKFRNDDYFYNGLKRIETAYERKYTIALMCSEKEPINCHRYFLISKSLEQRFSDWLDIEHIVKNQEGNIITISNQELDRKLVELILNKSEIKKIDIFNTSIFGDAKIENYYGESMQEKIADFCDRYWNLIHGWKKINNKEENKFEDYD